MIAKIGGASSKTVASVLLVYFTQHNTTLFTIKELNHLTDTFQSESSEQIQTSNSEHRIPCIDTESVTTQPPSIQFDSN